MVSASKTFEYLQSNSFDPLSSNIIRVTLSAVTFCMCTVNFCSSPYISRIFIQLIGFQFKLFRYNRNPKTCSGNIICSCNNFTGSIFMSKYGIWFAPIHPNPYFCLTLPKYNLFMYLHFWLSLCTVAWFLFVCTLLLVLNHLLIMDSFYFLAFWVSLYSCTAPDVFDSSFIPLNRAWTTL